MPIDALRLAKLIERHGAALQLWVHSCCDSPEDAVQEAFTKLAAQDPEPDNPVAWLY
jgi:DNA-directed RNA polymerase specialized sigma24 family protein